MQFVLLLLAAPFLVVAVHKWDAGSITLQDELNRSLLLIVYAAWLIFGDDLPSDTEVAVSLVMLAACCLVWFVFWLIPWLEWLLFGLMALLSLIGLLGPDSSLGQLFIFLGASLFSVMIFALEQAGDSTAARYRRGNWVNPSPLERKVGRDLVYNKPIKQVTSKTEI